MDIYVNKLFQYLSNQELHVVGASHQPYHKKPSIACRLYPVDHGSQNLLVKSHKLILPNLHTKTPISHQDGADTSSKSISRVFAHILLQQIFIVLSSLTSKFSFLGCTQFSLHYFDLLFFHTCFEV